jgi:hypothetical protein
MLGYGRGRGAKEAQAEGGRGDPRCGWTNIYLCGSCEASLGGSFFSTQP